MATPQQMRKLIEVFEGTLTEKLQVLFKAGLLTDLRDADPDLVDREEFRRVLQLKPLTSLLDPISRVIVRATTTSFVVQNHFKTKEQGGICSYLSPNFMDWTSFRTEPPRPEMGLLCSKLGRRSNNRWILQKLGPNAEIRLSQIFDLMETYRLSKGLKYLFYTRMGRIHDNLCVVEVLRDDGGYTVGASWFDCSHEYEMGVRVFSRDF